MSIDSTVRTEPKYAIKIVDNGSGLIYVAHAFPGSLEANAVWRIKRIDVADPTNVKITWADGNSSFDNVATDPTLLSYS